MKLEKESAETRDGRSKKKETENQNERYWKTFVPGIIIENSQDHTDKTKGYDARSQAETGALFEAFRETAVSGN